MLALVDRAGSLESRDHCHSKLTVIGIQALYDIIKALTQTSKLLIVKLIQAF